MTEGLPQFAYHPDPFASGVFEESDAVCRCCEQTRGLIYTGPVYAEEELTGSLCPWCIADGSAHAKFGASFTDEGGIGGHGAWEAVSPEVVAAVAYRTAGFFGWQQERWWTHCADAAAFLGTAGIAEMKAYGEQAVAAIAEESGYEGEELARYLKALKKERSPTAYVFQCRHCGAYGGYSDSD